MEDRGVIVTGAARGIGKAIAFAFIREGAKVALVDLNKNGLESAGNETGKGGNEVMTIPCDITSSEEVEAMVNQVERAFGRVDVLVNNAGIIRRGDIEAVTEKDWDDVMAVNLKGAFNCCRSVVSLMKRQSYGKIINVSSVAATTGD